MREHYATFVAHAEATYAAPLPRYVTDAFERYLACADFSRGFVRCHCDGCGHDVLVSFSCKQRGLCPSCGARRMCDEAANITDRILPSAPVRQWVMSLPFELRGLAATKPDVLTALGRIFAEEVARATKRIANVAGAETGAVSFPQRFGGSLNLHVHFHLLSVDAVFDKHGDGVRLHEAPPPSKEDVGDVVQKPPDGVARRKKPKSCASEPPASAPTPDAAAAVPVPARNARQANGSANAPANVPPSNLALSPVSAASGTRPSVANVVPPAFDDPTTITVKHWHRLLDGELFATSSRVDWALLMQRTFGFDALRCPKCDQKMRVLSTITDPAVVKKILSHLDLRTDPLPRARARDPTGQMDFGDYAA